MTYNLRGLPLGYLNQLENRLDETEAALFRALTTLRSVNAEPPIAYTSSTSDAGPRHKAARMQEWSRLPLSEWSDINHWWQAKTKQFTVTFPSSTALPDTISLAERSASLDGPRYGQRNDMPMDPFEGAIPNALSMGTPQSNLSPHPRESRPALIASPTTDRYITRAQRLAADPSEYIDRRHILGRGEAGRNYRQTSAHHNHLSKAGQLCQKRPSVYF